MSYSNYEQTVVLNGYALSGIQDVNGSYGISESPVKVAGVGFIDALVESPLEGNFSISRKMKLVVLYYMITIHREIQLKVSVLQKLD